MMLRFFFTPRFNRFDTVAIVACSGLFYSGEINFLIMLALLIAGFALSGVGEELLRRRQPA